MDNEPGEVSPRDNTTVDITKPHEHLLGNVINIDGHQIGTSKWEEMLSLTQNDRKERGVIVSSILGKTETGKIFEGVEEIKGISASTTPPIFDSFRKFFLEKRLALTHTHPMTDELNHLSTSIFTDADIQSFYQTTYNAVVAIDRGGAHLLLKTRKPYEENIPPNNLVRKRFSEVENTTGLIKDAIRLVAEDLEQYGIAYYFCPDVSSAPGTRTFQRARTYFAKKASEIPEAAA